MALNDKKSGFGFDMEEKFRKVTTPKTDGKKPDVDDYTHTHTHVHAHDDVLEPKQQERKQKRVQLLTYESLISRMDAYAAKRGVSRAAVFEAAMNAFLDKVDSIDPKK